MNSLNLSDETPTDSGLTSGNELDEQETNKYRHKENNKAFIQYKLFDLISYNTGSKYAAETLS